MQLLAFDYGLKNIGVASGQSETGFATARTPLKARDGIPDWDQLAALLEEWRPELVLVGLPLNMDGSESELSTRARKFARRLEGRFGIKTELVDERLSSFEAKGEVMAQGGSRDSPNRRNSPSHRNYAKHPVDGIAARIILETYLNQP